MLDERNNFVIENYHLKSTFSSFLPGINGELGIPLWCYYVNRGQCVSCFGVQDKNHAVMEFYPAHQAYERTPLLGFRTFLRVDGQYEEAFADRERQRSMVIGMNSLSIGEECQKYRITVEYETLPREPVAALMREVRITNLSGSELFLEAADGMAELIPYGINGSSMKEMGQTSKAWMEVLDLETGVPKFKVRASMEDSAEVSEVEGMNFAFARGNEGQLLSTIVDREVMFQSDTALIRAWGFEEDGVENVVKNHQVTCNDVPCCFFITSKLLAPMETLVIREIYGTAGKKTSIERIEKETEDPDWFSKKQQEAVHLAEKITNRIATKSGNPVFDAYCRQDYLDNLLRGGYPMKISPKKTFYLYSRKHGDMERDYNFFSMLPEPYSQGNGNFRDVNQNRRCDVFFSPFVGEGSIRMFYNAIQLNGYNPLGIEKVTYTLEAGRCEALIGEKWAASDCILQSVLRSAFTPGKLMEALGESGVDESEREKLFCAIMDEAVQEDGTKFLEGYWCDHWTYNLDLVEAYLAIFPEEREKLLFEDETYRFRQADQCILPRRKRYEKTDRGIRQYHFLKENVNTEKDENRYLRDRSGSVVVTNLASKMFTLIITKMAALDPYGMGVEMEGGKPGWYDALNGLPGLLGSSMAETYELMRCVAYLEEAAAGEGKELVVLKEAGDLAEAICKAAGSYRTELLKADCVAGYWNAVNDAKESFWEVTAKEVSGETTVWDNEKLSHTLKVFSDILRMGIEKAGRLGRGVRPTYFYYRVTDWEETEAGILPLSFEVMNTPDFLEGSVHSLKIASGCEEKREIYNSVRESRLYDRKLHMYKVNASLSEATFELGRACAFTPGWLENESVWLHMEYKYLLELLKAGLYKEFMEDFKQAAVPFLSEETYGRSLLENSSFIASSANPNPKYHGKGFVARLSGSTAEFLEMWEILMFGKRPFTVEAGELKLTFSPCIPEYLIGDDKRLECTFLGSVPVVYELPDTGAIVPGNYRIGEIRIAYEGGEECWEEAVCGVAAERVRAGNVRLITVKIVRQSKKMTPY